MLSQGETGKLQTPEGSYIGLLLKYLCLKHVPMKTIRDCFGRLIRLTDERIAHILQHPEMIEMEPEIARVLQEPAEVRL